MNRKMTRGLFVPLDVNYRDDPKVLVVTPLAELTYVRSLALAKRLGGNGFIHKAHLRGLCDGYDYEDGVGSDREWIGRQLVEAGLWLEAEGGWQIAAWLKHNPSDDELASAKQSERDRKRQWRESQRDATSRDEVSHGTERDATPSEEKRRQSERASAPADDFAPNDTAVAFCAEHGLDLPAERDWWLDNCRAKGLTYKDHQAAFRTWIRNAVKFGRGGKPSEPATLDYDTSPRAVHCKTCNDTGKRERIIDLGPNERPGVEWVECDHQEVSA